MTNYSGAWKVIKFMLMGAAAAFLTYIVYIVIGMKSGYITTVCVEYVEVVDIISVNGSKTTVLTIDGEQVLNNTSVKQGKEGYCVDWESVEEWRDGE